MLFQHHYFEDCAHFPPVSHRSRPKADSLHKDVASTNQPQRAVRCLQWFYQTHRYTRLRNTQGVNMRLNRDSMKDLTLMLLSWQEIAHHEPLL